jgi:predicted dehydrogenase
MSRARLYRGFINRYRFHQKDKVDPILYPGSFHRITAAQYDGEEKIPARFPSPVILPPIHATSEKQDQPLFTPLAPRKKIGYAIVGLGHLSLEQIMPAFGKCKYSKPVALVSGDTIKANKVADQYGIAQKNIYSYNNFTELENNSEIDAVYIVLPNQMHEEYTIRATMAGKHVLCEKPMATSEQAAKRMINAAEKANRKLMIAYRIQYEPYNKLAMQWTRSGEHGKVKLIELSNAQNIGDPNQWRLNKQLAGGGSLPDIGIYNLNTARFLTGEEPEWVMASLCSTPGDVRFKEVEESVMFQLGFPSGVLANCTCSYGVHQSRYYRCLTDKGAWFGLDPAFAYHGLQMFLSEAKEKHERKQQIIMEEQNQFALEIDHFSTAIMEDKQPGTPGEEGLKDVQIMDAIYQSAKEGRRIVIGKAGSKNVAETISL